MLKTYPCQDKGGRKRHSKGGLKGIKESGVGENISSTVNFFLRNHLNQKNLKTVFLLSLLTTILTIGSHHIASAQILPKSSQTVLGNIVIAPVKLDGYILFEIASPLTLSQDLQTARKFPSIQQRVERIEKTLYGILRNSDRQTLKVEVGSLNKQTIIFASDEKQLRQITIATVTDLDAQVNGIPVPELAEKGTEVIYQALIRAWDERTSKYLLRQSIIAVVTLVTISGISKGLNILVKRVQQRASYSSYSQENLHLIKRFLFPLIILIIWLPSISLILELFPYTRAWGILFFKNTLILSGILILFLVIAKVLDLIYKKYKPIDAYQLIVFKSLVELVWIVLIIIFFVLIISIIFDTSPLNVLAGFGAAGAIFLLIFKDSLQGFIAGIQLAGNKMIALGDLIEMPQYNVYGDVIDVSLVTVKVRNRDQSIVSIPSYALISQSFINWKAMEKLGARRIMRAIYIDINTIKFCSEDLLLTLGNIEHIANYINHFQSNNKNNKNPLLNERLTNLELLQIYLKLYLQNHPKIRQDMTLVVRHLAPNQCGIPLEIYCFCQETKLADYEWIQSQIFNHILSVVNYFELKVFQSPSGDDLHKFNHS